MVIASGIVSHIPVLGRQSLLCTSCHICWCRLWRIYLLEASQRAAVAMKRLTNRETTFQTWIRNVTTVGARVEELIIRLQHAR